MRKLGIWMLAATAAALIFGPATAVAHDEKAGLDGAYEFVRLDTPNGPQETQIGMLVVADGRLCHIRVAKDREAMSREDTDEQRTLKAAAAFRSANGTCGTYTLQDDKVVASWTVSFQPGGEGNSSEFIVTRDGDWLTLAPAGAPDFKFVYKRAE